MSRHCSKYFTDIKSLNPHNNHLRRGLLRVPFYPWENRHREAVWLAGGRTWTYPESVIPTILWKNGMNPWGQELTAMRPHGHRHPTAKWGERARQGAMAELTVTRMTVTLEESILLQVPKKGSCFHAYAPPWGPGNSVLVLGAPFQSIQRSGRLRTFKTMLSGDVGVKGTHGNAAFWKARGSHVDEEEFRSLWAAPTTAGVHAEARHQIVGPDNPVISANDLLFSDAKWFSDLQETIQEWKNPVPTQRRDTNKAVGRKHQDSREELLPCGWVRIAALQPRVS